MKIRRVKVLAVKGLIDISKPKERGLTMGCVNLPQSFRQFSRSRAVSLPLCRRAGLQF
jgi:hypothetical protein